MREIINLQIGQGGNQIGLQFWQTLCKEHGISYDGQYEQNDQYFNDLINVYFDEVSQQRYQARSLQIDTDNSIIDHIQASDIKSLFNPFCCISGGYGSGHNYGKGRYECEIEEEIIDKIREITEKCDKLQGFQLIRSLGGGTGSGLGDKILQEIKEEYPSSIVTNFCIYPSPLVSDTVVEPYNAVLCTLGLIEYSDSCFVFDNAALYNISNKIQGIKQPIYKDLNNIVVQAISGVTSQWRFHNNLYYDMRRFCINLNPFSQLKFLNVTLAPLENLQYSNQKKVQNNNTNNLSIMGLNNNNNNINNNNVSEMISMLKNNRNSTCHTEDIQNCQEFSSISIFRGENICEQELEEFHKDAYKYERRYQFIPDGHRYNVCKQTYNNEQRNTAVKISSGSSIKESFQILGERFNTMFKRKAFLHFGYACMDEMEFTEAYHYLLDILEEYNQYENNIYSQKNENQNDDGDGDQNDNNNKSFIDTANQFISDKLYL